MEIALIMTLISINLVTGVLLGLALFLDRDGIFRMLKLRLKKGSGMVLIFGKDGKLYFETAKFSGKKSDTESIEVNGLPYNLNKKKIRYYRTYPILVYDEGVSEPLDISSGDLNYGKVTPELLSQMIILARRSGQMPKEQNQREQLIFYATIGSAIASATAVFLIFNMSNDFQTLKNIAQATLEAVKVMSGV